MRADEPDDKTTSTKTCALSSDTASSQGDITEKTPELDPQQRLITERYFARQKQRPSPRVKVTKEAGNIRVAPDHPHEMVGSVLLMDFTGDHER